MSNIKMLKVDFGKISAQCTITAYNNKVLK